MTQWPETRESLLLKIRDPRDVAAWEQFVAAYRPAVYRLARRRGLQDADAEDLAQQVMASVARAIVHWRKDDARGTFRGWLARVARNACLNLLTRGRLATAAGGTSIAEQLEQWPAGEDAIARLVEEEHQRAIFRLAADEVMAEFEQTTWRSLLGDDCRRGLGRTGRRGAGKIDRSSICRPQSCDAEIESPGERVGALSRFVSVVRRASRRHWKRSRNPSFFLRV